MRPVPASPPAVLARGMQPFPALAPPAHTAAAAVGRDTHCSAGRLPANTNSADDAVVLQRIRQQFDARAPAYDTDNTYHPPLARRLLQLAALRPGDSLLDLAAGTGLVGLAAAAALGPLGRVVLLDASEGMLAQARAKHAAMVASSAAAAGDAMPNTPGASTSSISGAGGEGGQGGQQQRQQQQQQQQQQPAQVHFVQGDMEELASCLPREWLGSFDAITCAAAAPFLRQPGAALASWRAWLKQPGGVLAFHTFVAPGAEDFDTFGQVMSEAGLAVPDPCSALGSEGAVTAALQAAGFADVQVTPEAKERWIPATSAEAYARRMWDTCLHNNPFLAPEAVHAVLPGQQDLEARREAFVAGVVERVVADGRLDPAGQRVRSRATVLHVRARVA